MRSVRAADAFDVVIPSLPGFGFSGKPSTTGWDPDHIARAWTVLMKRLGYTQFVAQGGDWGAMVTDVMGTQAPPELLGIHLNWSFAVPPAIDTAIQTGGSLPSDPSSDERHACDQLAFFYSQGVALRPEDEEPSSVDLRHGGPRRSAWPPGSSTTTSAATK